MKPTVSVIIPTFNRASFLSDAINSAVKQSLQNIEILIVDDGSDDATMEVVEPFVRRDAVRYFWQENKGVAAARNKGMKEATGEYIAFLDSDDLWKREHLARLVNALQHSDEVKLGFSGFRFVGAGADADHHNAAFGDSVKRLLATAFSQIEHGQWVSNTGLLASFLQFGFPFRVQGGIVCRKFVKKYELCFDESLTFTEDAQFVIEAALYTKVLYIDSIGLLVRRHSENLGDRCYQGKVVASYERRKERMKQFFKGQLEGVERQALNRALWQMSEYIMKEKGKHERGFSRILAAARLIKEFPTYDSCKSVVKWLLK